MKKLLFTVLVALLYSVTIFGQLTGIKTIPGNYATVAEAIADLNANGVGTGGVTFYVAAGYTETFTLPSNGSITTLTGTAANPIAFIKSGTGANPVITAAAGVGTVDGIISIGGCDYITFDGINLKENPLNTTNTTQMEWGYSILKASASDGAQNITIKNCKVSLASGYNGAIGIYSNNHVIGNNVQLTGVTGTNSNLKIYNDSITSCYTGIYLGGYNDPTVPYQYFDQNNEIGLDGANNITNLAGGTTAGYGIYAIYQNNLKVANNRITSTMGGAGAANGIYLAAARNASWALFNNFISIQYSGTGTLYAIYSEMGANGTSNTSDIYGNTVAGCTYPTATSSTIRYMYVNSPGVYTNVYNNSVINNIAGSSTTTATGQVQYIYINKTSTTPGYSNIHDNNVGGNTHIQSAPGSSTIYYLAALGSGLGLELYNNQVTNNIAGTSGGTYGLYVYFENGAKNVYNNLVSGISGASGSTYGLYQTSSSSNALPSRFYKNTVRDIEGTLATTYMNGIYCTAPSNSPHYFYNNMVSDLRATAGTRTSNPIISVYGFNIAGGNSIYIYNNTVYLNATSTGANFGTASIFMNTSSKEEVRNNIFINTSVPNGTGKTNGFYFSSNNLTNYLNTSNFNNIYSGTPGPNNVLYNDGTVTEQDILPFKNRMFPRETQSVTENTPFVNTSTKPYDLHIRTNVPTQCEAGGSVVEGTFPVITDFDNQPRYPNAGYPVNGSFSPNAPDIGADEFGGLSNDLTAPFITFTPLSDTNTVTQRTLVATIVDGTGVPVSGTGLPRLYWNINTGAYQSVQANYIPGNKYSFTFGSGVESGDTVHYYIVAQDLAATPNVGANPYLGASGYSANPPACSNPPYTPEDYKVIPEISGIFHVGVGKDYTTLTAAVNDINLKWIAAPVTLLLDDPTYPSEGFPIILNPNLGASPTSTLTIKPNPGNNALISGSINTNLIDIRGFDYLILDGSNNGSNSRNLTIQNTSTVTGATGIGVSCYGGVDPASNFIIKNTIIQCTPVHSSIVSIVSIRFSSTGGGYNNFKIMNNKLIGAFDGIVLVGSGTGLVQNGEISNNIIGSPNSGEYVTHTGVSMQSCNNVLIKNNEIMGPAEGSLNVGQTGIYLGSLTTNTKIQRNRIHDFVRTADDGWGVSGIWYAAEATSVTEISNNLLYNIKSPGINPGVGQNITYGIFIRSGGNIQILHNTIYLTGQMSTDYSASSACIGFYYQATGNNNRIVNNILVNSMTFTGATPMYGRPYAIMVSGSPAALFSQIDYNDYYINGTNGAIGQWYTNGTGTIVDYLTLADWQTATGQDAHTVTVNPNFTSDTYLLPTNTALNNLGTYLAEVPVDYTGAQRNNPSDMGAYEFGSDPFVITLTANSITTSSANITGATNPGGGLVYTYFDWGLTNSYGNTSTATPPSVSGSTTTPISASLSGLSYGTTYHYRARTVKSSGLISYGADSIFTTLPLAPSVITTEATGITHNSATLNGTVNPNGGLTTVTIEWGTTTSYGNVIPAIPGSISGFDFINVSKGITGLTPYTVYHFRVVATNASGTIYGNDMVFQTLAIPSTVITNIATNILGFEATLNGMINANYAPTNASFEWGLTTSYGNTSTATPALVTGNVLTPVSAILTDLTPATTYHFRCVGSGPGGIIYGEDLTFISDCPTPATAGEITGDQDVCVSETGVIYSVEPVYLATGYNWTLPSGATIVAGNNTNEITVDFSSTAVSGTISVFATNDCGIGNSSSLAINLHPLPVATVSGPNTGCEGAFDNFYTTEAGMTNYTWTVTGGTITSGAGTNTINVTWNATGTQTVSVSYATIWGCQTVSPASMSVAVSHLAQPTILGDNMNCVGAATSVYTTEQGFYNYLWTVTSGGQIVGGQGTYQVEINWVNSGNQTVSVTYSTINGCYPANPTTMSVNIMPVPAAPGAITGTPEVCAGTENVQYSVQAVPNALSYVWNLPAGASIVDGEGTNIIKVDFAMDAESGNITVYAVNNCGAGNSSPNYHVTVNPIPPTPVVTMDENNVLHSSAPEGNQWYFEGDLIPGATEQDYQATEEGIYWTIVTLNGCSSEESNHYEVIFTGLDEMTGSEVTVYPVPNKGRFTVSIRIEGEESFNIFVYNDLGMRVYEMPGVRVSGKFQQEISLSDPTSGMYTLVLAGDRHTITRKLFVSK